MNINLNELMAANSEMFEFYIEQVVSSENNPQLFDSFWAARDEPDAATRKAKLAIMFIVVMLGKE